MQISAVIIAGNEELKIADAIRSVTWADEVFVVDSESTDATREIATAFGARVITQPWLGFARQKQFAVEKAEHDWILSIDADERVSEELQKEIRTLLARPQNTLAAGYRIPRLTYYLGRPVRHGGWYPDRQLRVFHRRRGRWSDRFIHESWQVNEGERVESLSGELLHFTVDSLDEHDRMIRERYAPLGARQMFASGKRTTPLRSAIAGPAAFITTYLLKLGFLDGSAGLHIARFAALHARLKHEALMKLQSVA